MNQHIDPVSPRRGSALRFSLLGLLGLSVAACSTESGEAARGISGSPVDVAVSEIVSRPASGSWAATVEASNEAHIATRVSGRIRELPVDVGTRVRAGDVLVTLDDADVRAAVEQARSGAELARRSFGRIEALAADGAASDQELDEARARLDAAEAQLESARSQLGYTELTAPFGGVVTERRADPGDLAGPGQPILTLVGDGTANVVAELPGALSARVSEGTSASVTDPRSGRSFRVRISRVVPSLSPTARSFRVEAPLPADSGLLPGAFVRLGLPDSGESTRWIPSDAVMRRGQLTGVFTVEDDRLRLRWIRTGEERDRAVELLSGPDGAVVREVHAGLSDGDPARIVATEPWTPSFSDTGVQDDSDSAETSGTEREEVR